MAEPTYDIAIIGGGINGCGIARDAAGRGLSVFLCDEGDLGAATSSASTKLIHGGLRYLEFYEFRLVREALAEREVLWRIAPHIVRPLRLVLPYHKGLRPRWLLRLGLFVYDHLGGRKLLPGTRSLDLSRDPAGAALKPSFRHAFEFSDCAVDDSRLVILNAVDARDRGASVNPRTRCDSAVRVDGEWELSLRQPGTGLQWTTKARVLINAGGPWVADVLANVTRTPSPTPVRLIKGSHIVVPRLFEGDRAYLFQNGDGRVDFAIPYQRDFTLIGTTDEDFSGDPRNVAIDDGEIDYLCRAANEYFRVPIGRGQIVWTYSGVRPLHGDRAASARAASRDYFVELDTKGGAPLVNVFGGKITTYRRLAEHVLKQLRPHLTVDEPWTAATPLPGGDFPVGAIANEVASLRGTYPFLAEDHALRLVSAYGTRCRRILGKATRIADLGERFGTDLTAVELRYLIDQEWAWSVEDILWRRTKLGLHFDAAERDRLQRWFDAGCPLPHAEMSVEGVNL